MDLLVCFEHQRLSQTGYSSKESLRGTGYVYIDILHYMVSVVVVIVDTVYHQYKQSINQSCNLKTQKNKAKQGYQCFVRVHQSLNVNSAVGFRDTGVVCGVKLSARGPVLFAELGASLSITFLWPLLR